MKPVALLLPFLLPLVQAQDLPAGKGKKLVEDVCAACHGLDVVVTQHATKEGWASIVADMMNRGASATDEQVKTIVEYLAANFGKEQAEKPSH